MASKSSQSISLQCSQCGFANEAERVYCHNCGAKLDRSLLPKEEERRQESPEKTRKRVARMTNPQANSLGREFKTLCKVAIGSALVAALFLLAQKPEGVPPAKRELAERLVTNEVMEAVNSPTARALSFSEEDINKQLRQSLKESEGAIPGVRFQRAYVALFEGAVRISSEQSFWGYPIYASEIYQLTMKEGKFTPVLLGGSFGRLAVDPRLMKYADFYFQNLWDALKHQRTQMDRMQMVQAHPQRIDLVTKAGTP